MLIKISDFHQYDRGDDDQIERPAKDSLAFEERRGFAVRNHTQGWVSVTICT